MSCKIRTLTHGAALGTDLALCRTEHEAVKESPTAESIAVKGVSGAEPCTSSGVWVVTGHRVFQR